MALEAKPKTSTRERVEQLKQLGEDFEWYPTTAEMIQVIVDDICKFDRQHYYRGRAFQFMDVGAGDGRVLAAVQAELPNAKLFAIEKSMTHVNAMDQEVVVIGTDFHQQTLVDKPMSVIFSNPPYSEYAQWVTRILKEGVATHTYMIIPRRWSGNQQIQQVVKSRDIKFKLLAEFDFEDAERAARANVAIVRFNTYRENDEAMREAILEMLPDLDLFDEAAVDSAKVASEADGSKRTGVRIGQGIIPTLVESYNEDLDQLFETFRAITKMEPALLLSLGVTKDAVVDALSLKLKNLKSVYWARLFEHTKEVTKKLTTKPRAAMLESLRSERPVDFTESNIYSTLIWITKNASSYIDSQLVKLFKDMSQAANVERYKSNHKVFVARNHRYLQEDASHYKLDYRIVLEGLGGIYTGDYSFQSVQGLTEYTAEFLSDFITVANTLGFDSDDAVTNYQWVSQRKIMLKLNNGETMTSVKAHKKGTIHLQINQKLILAINIQAGRLLGWLRSPEEAVEQLKLEGEDAEFAEKYFQPSLLASASQLRITQPEVSVDHDKDSHDT